MNTFRPVIALLCVISTAAVLTGTTPPSSPPGTSPGTNQSPAGSRAPGELAALEQFLNLSDAELAQLQDVISRLRAMSPAERAALRDEIAAFRKLPEPQRLQMRQGWGMMPPEIQDAWREMMQSTTPAEHAEIQKKMQSLPPDERMRYRRQLVEAYLKAKTAKKP